MLLKLRERMTSEKGFTLIELLVVMLIIGILAAIAIPTFFNQKNKAKDSDSKALAHTAQTAIETFGVDHNGSYVGATGAKLHDIEETVPATLEVTDSGGVTGSVPGTDSYRVTATSSTGDTFSVDRNGGTFTYPCSGTAGGCPDTLRWDGG